MTQEMTYHFDLPPLVAKQVLEKRYASQPDLTTLKPQQKEAYDRMTAFLAKEDGGMFLLKGYAGTGKTYVISRVNEQYLFENSTNQVAVTAPTNKAVKVLYVDADFKHTNLDYLTIHKLLGLKEQINKNGEVEFKQDKRFPPSITEKQLLIIDEVSMLNDDLFGMIEPYLYSHGLKVIMMGDPAQIPPVGRPECIPLTETGQQTYNIEVFELTEIQRQALGNPIVEATFKIRNALGRANSFPIRETTLLDNGSGVLFISKSETSDRELFQDLLERYFASDNFKTDADFCKVIAWRNKTVETMNNIIRRMIYGQDRLPRIMNGEKLIANKPIFDGEYIIFNTNDEMEVVEYVAKTDAINGGKFHLDYYSAKVKFITPDNQIKHQIIKIIHEDSLNTYDSILDLLRKVALSKPKGSFEAIQGWQDFYLFQQLYADVNYNYAITAHKAQGSTYDRVFVMEGDINANRNIVERNRIKYTACSRPRHQLIITE